MALRKCLRCKNPYDREISLHGPRLCPECQKIKHDGDMVNYERYKLVKKLRHLMFEIIIINPVEADLILEDMRKNLGDDMVANILAYFNELVINYKYTDVGDYVHDLRCMDQQKYRERMAKKKRENYE